MRPARVPRASAGGSPCSRLRPAAAFASAVSRALLAGFAVSELARDDGDAQTLSAQVDQQRLRAGSASLSVPEDGGSVLRVDGLPDPGGDRVYQVWVERDGEVEPISIFDVDAAGDGAAAVPGSLDGVSAVMVT